MKKMKTVLAFLAFFTVLHSQENDSLKIAPSYPTIYDKITFTFIDPYACCATEYHNKRVKIAVDDKDIATGGEIYITYSFDNEPCTRAFCLPKTHWTSATVDHLSAGTYKIYASATPYCHEEPCPDYDLVPRFLGEITVIDPPVINESFIVIPPNPTSEDSLTIKILDPYGCCVTDYSHVGIATNPHNNNLLFSYKYDSTGCGVVDCASATNWLSATTGPQPAGEVCVFRQGIDANRGNVMVESEKLGCFTVTSASSESIEKPNIIEHHHRYAPIKSVCLFDITGRIVRHFYSNDTPLAMEHINRKIRDLPSGTYFMELKRVNSTKVKQLIRN